MSSAPSLLSLAALAWGRSLCLSFLLRGWAGLLWQEGLQQVTHQEPCVYPGAGNHQSSWERTPHRRALAGGAEQAPQRLRGKAAVLREAYGKVANMPTILSLAPGKPVGPHTLK